MSRKGRTLNLALVRGRLADALRWMMRHGYTPICSSPEHTIGSCMLCSAQWNEPYQHPKNNCIYLEAKE
jgi:hypothetical protein